MIGSAYSSSCPYSGGKPSKDGKRPPSASPPAASRRERVVVADAGRTTP